jgi:diadenosine tetraphosphatase ApaH/serine/threonine PP2A family protein phosphatase
VHSNLAAFEAVIERASELAPIDAIWALGDVVGYGPEPRECLALLRSFEHVCIAGNHDLAAARVLNVDDFNPAAALAAEWTATELQEADREYIKALPQVATEGDFTLVHGALWDPVWAYLVTSESARRHFEKQTTPYGFVGHSHLPLVYSEGGRRGAGLSEGDVLPLAAAPWVANPGSVGQPRDGDPRAAFALVDLEARQVAFHRVEYDIGRTQAKMRTAGLPESLIERLSYGR